MIEFTGYDGRTIYLAKDKIVGMQKLTEVATTIFVGCDTASEEWAVKEPLHEVLAKYNGAIE